MWAFLFSATVMLQRMGNKLLYLFLLLLFSRITGVAQSYNFKSYSVENGLPFIQISAIYQDKYGYLWSGGYGGLSRFDGRSFNNYSPRHGLANHFITSITEDENDNLWVGTIDGLSVFDQKKFMTYTSKEGLPDNKINCLITDTTGGLLVGTDMGLSSFVKDKFVQLLLFQNKQITCLIYDQANNLFIGTTNGLYKWSSGRLDSMAIAGRYNVKINSLKKGQHGILWAGTENGLLSFQPDFAKSVHYHINNGLIEENIACLEVDNKNNVWIGSQKGLMKFDGNRFYYYKVAIDHNANIIECLRNDYEQNLWIGTHAGLYKFRDEGFISYGPHDGLGNSWIHGLLGDNQKNLWIATRGGLYKRSGNTFYNYTTRDGLCSDSVYSIAKDKNNVIWIGTNRGLSILKGEHFNTIEVTKGKPCYFIFIDKSERIWIGTDGGIYGVDVNYRDYTLKIDHYTLPEFAENGKVWGIAQDNNNNFWIGTYFAGFFKFDGKKFTHMNKVLNISATDMLSVRFNPLYNKLYVSSFYGVYEIDPLTNKCNNFSEYNGLSSNLVWELYLTNNGNTLWAGTNQGVNKIDLHEYYTTGNKNIVAYSKPDGFRGVESNCNGTFEEKDGTIWFGTVNGLIRYNPRQFSENLQETKLNLTNVRLFYKDTLLKNGAELDPNLNNISFHYTAICLTNPEKVKYIHKLEGPNSFEKTWSPESPENYTTYSNLPPGAYTFKVRSCNNAGIWNLDPLSFSFTIKQPYWQRWWFLLSLFIGIICIILLIFRIRLNQVKKDQQKEAEYLIAVSTNELKALRAQMNPHFMFNSLNSIQHYIIANKDDEAVFYLNKFARLMRMILNNSEKASISIREEIDSLKLYLELEQMRFQNKFTWEFVLDEEIDTEYEKIPTMLLQPYIENAILHGLTPKKEMGKLVIEIRYQGKYLVCSIIDNGVGRAFSQELKAGKNREHESMGMKITQDRLRLLNHINQSNLSLKITDLKNHEGLPIGTKVDIFIPVS